MKSASELLDLVSKDEDVQLFKDLHWEGSFADYLGMALEDTVKLTWDLADWPDE